LRRWMHQFATHASSHIYAYMYVHVFIFVYIYMYIYVHIYVYILCIYIYIYICMYICIYTNLYMCIYKFVCVHTIRNTCFNSQKNDQVATHSSFSKTCINFQDIRVAEVCERISRSLVQVSGVGLRCRSLFIYTGLFSCRIVAA